MCREISLPFEGEVIFGGDVTLLANTTPPQGPYIKSELLHKVTILSGQAQVRSGTNAAILNGRSGPEKRSETIHDCSKMTRDENGRRAFENQGITY